MRESKTVLSFQLSRACFSHITLAVLVSWRPGEGGRDGLSLAPALS